MFSGVSFCPQRRHLFRPLDSPLVGKAEFEAIGGLSFQDVSEVASWFPFTKNNQKEVSVSTPDGSKNSWQSRCFAVPSDWAMFGEGTALHATGAQ